MLDKEICMNCKKAEGLTISIHYRRAFELRWKEGKLFCLHTRAAETRGLISTDKIPDTCKYKLEQILSQ